MNNYTAVSIAEGWCNHTPTEQETIDAWQHLIDTGLAWTLQGWFGRQAVALIEQGVCSVPSGKVVIV